MTRAEVQKNVVAMMPKGAAAEGSMSDAERFCEMAKDIVERLPKHPFDIEAVTRAYPPTYYDGTNVVLARWHLAWQLGILATRIRRCRGSESICQLLEARFFVPALPRSRS